MTNILKLFRLSITKFYLCNKFVVLGKIYLKNMKFYAYHGCLGEEKKIGADYVVNLEITANLENPSKTDKLKDAIDYVLLNEIVGVEMKKRSNLLENVADRIAKRVFNSFASVDAVKVLVSKKNPPVRGSLDDVSVSIKRKRN